jgi:hypothetical protein
MRIQIPLNLHPYIYFGLDTKAGLEDEFIGVGISSLYVGIYPLRRGFELAVGITDENGCL